MGATPAKSRGSRKFRFRRAAGFAAAATLLLFTNIAARAEDDSGDQSLAALQQMSIEQLGNIQVTSVSKAPESLSNAPAAIYVITHDEIMRSGATSLPEILRLAPNLQVAQMSAQSWAITARGFNGNAADKLLVLIDGRSVYTPLYGGVLWDEKFVLPEDIDRIEIISGPGSTLWGANAVNGVINIITRKAADTHGGSLDLYYGNLQSGGSLQYGGSLGDDLDYRLYGEGFNVRGDKTSQGLDAHDGWSKGQSGFRLDWTPGNDTVTLQSDYYRGAEDTAPAGNQNVYGGNIESTWQHQFSDGSSLQLLAYYDATRRYVNGFGYSLDTYDIEMQHSFTAGDWNSIVWGGGYRLYKDDFRLAGALVQFLPPKLNKTLTDVFAQDTMSLNDSLDLILGLKLESDPFSGWAPLPNARLSWRLNDTTMVWAAASRAVRAPTRFDVDLQDVIVPSVLILQGNPDFKSEKLDAYDIGARMQPSDDFSFSVSAFYNDYRDLRSTEWLNMDVTNLPLLWEWGNKMEGHTYGVEAWGNYQVADWWRLTAGFNIQHIALRFKPDSSALGGTATAGDDPNHQASLKSSINLGPDVMWDADLRWIGRLPNPRIPSYTELNTKLAWNVTDALQLSVSGLNLLHAHHLEYEQAGATVGDEVDRSFYVETKWRF